MRRNAFRLLGKYERHDSTRTLLYRVYASMIQRCEDVEHRAFSRYGGRGIKVCKRWRISFTNFLLDMGPRPSLLHSIDRKDNDGDYEPTNCRWATDKEQARNSSHNVLITVSGETHCMSEWEEIKGFPRATVWQRINKLGWSPEQAVMTPLPEGKEKFNPNPLLSKEKAAEIRVKWKSGVSQRLLGLEYGVARTTIQSVVNGRSWT